MPNPRIDVLVEVSSHILEVQHPLKRNLLRLERERHRTNIPRDQIGMAMTRFEDVILAMSDSLGGFLWTAAHPPFHQSTGVARGRRAR